MRPGTRAELTVQSIFRSTLLASPSRLVLTAIAALTTASLLLPADAEAYRASFTRQRAAEKQKLSAPEGPLLAVISLRDQRLSLYGRDGLITSSTVSTGTPGHLTPTGVFSVLEKHREHYSNIYGGASMPHMQRITWSGVAMHAGYVTGRPASHGCIRLPPSFASDLFGITKVGMRVVVTPDGVAPKDIEHAGLFVSRRAIAEETPSPASRPSELTRVAALTNEDVKVAAPQVEAIVAEAGIASQATREAAGADAAARAKALQAARRETGEKAKIATRAADVMRRAAAPQLAEQARLAKAVQAAERQLRSDERVLASLNRAKDAAGSDAARERMARPIATSADKVTIARSRLEAATTQQKERREAHANLLDQVKVAEDLKAVAVETYRELVRRGEPISVFISAKTGMLQIRQAFDPIYEIPVTIRDREQRRLGTHVFTATDVKESVSGNDSGQVRWSVVSVPDSRHAADTDRQDGRRGNARRNAVVTPPVSPDVDQPAAALDRIEIPQEAKERIAALLVAGSSLILSDEGPSIETGKGTDFVILTK